MGRPPRLPPWNLIAAVEFDLPNVCQQWFGFGSVTELLTPFYTAFLGIIKAPPVGLERGLTPW
jgi:hypothetical protein